MIEVETTPEQINQAIQMANDLGKLNNSITKGSGNIAGFLGEIVLLDWLKSKSPIALHENTYNYDLRVGDIKIDVKTKRSKTKPLPHYMASVADFNTAQKCDLYAFVRVSYDNLKVWLCGYKSKESFYQQAKFIRAGEYDPDNRWTCKADCYSLPYSKLEKFGE